MTVAIAIPFLKTAFALTDVGGAGVFELDGNIYHDSSASSTTLPEDWGGCSSSGIGSCPTGRGLFDASGNTNPLPPGGLDAHWVNDGPHATTDFTTFTTGSKDSLDISNGGWQCVPSGNITPKDDILHAYSFGIIPTAGPRVGDTLLYGGFERFANNGAGDIGFWLLQDPNVACSSLKSATSFNGTHVVGDVLTVAEFSTGGTVTTVNEFEWVGISKAFPLGLMNITSTGAADCSLVSDASTNNVCARSNTGPISSLPWSTQDKTSAANTLATAEFFEVGIDITRLLPGAGCINKFLFDTRTSTSLTATLKDYALGVLTSCPSATISTSVSPTPIALGQSATDTATVSLTPSTFTVSGTVTFNVYGPFSTDPTGNPTVCTSNNLITPFSPDTKAISGASPASVTSDPFTPSAQGYYAWIATYNPASINNGNTNSTACGDTGETLLVLSIPKITAFGFTNTPTNNDPVSGSGTVGYSVTITNYAAVDITVSGTLAVTSTGSVTCTGGNTLALSGSIAASGGTKSFSLSCMYSGNSGDTVTAIVTAMFTDVAGSGPVSGSPTTYTFTIQKT